MKMNYLTFIRKVWLHIKQHIGGINISSEYS